VDNGFYKRKNLKIICYDGRYIGKSPQPHKPKDQGIIPIIVDLPQTTKSGHKVNNQKQDHQVTPEDGRNLVVLKALLQTILETKLAKQDLKDQQPGERSQLLVLKTDYRNLMVLGLNFCFTGLHLRWPPGYG
jgi:hypothetical protein